MYKELIYRIGITLIPGVGDVNAKSLISYCGSAEAVFKEKKEKLMKIPGIGSITADAVCNQDVLGRAEEEIKFIEKHKIIPLFYLDEDYPKRLKHCSDSPIMLYYKGTADLNRQKIISIVGTRMATDYGKKICENLIKELAPYNIMVVSGLAYGIDVCAHKAAIANDLPTVAVVAHGLDKIYPSAHRSTAEKMLKNGGLLTDFISKTNPDKENFPKRNRIVAGISDATIVVESGKDGGSLITADIANSYNRDVFAFPGKVDDKYSEGCNHLIKSNRAGLIQSAQDILYIMGWEEAKEKKKPKQQKELFIELGAEEKAIVNVLKDNEQLNIDELCYKANLPMSKISTLLLTLEFSGIIKSLPGKMYQLN